ncbi:hypothetical protein EMCRGX_G029953 [Ephydatia muelleri]
MEHIKPPPEMDFASSDGTSVAETWRKWRQSMELFLTLAMTGKTEREQCSAFLYIISPAGRDIYNTFNVSDQDKNKISILFQKFEGYCKPKQNVTVERYRFNTRSQQEGESIDQYVTALKLMTRNCAFGTLEEELIRDRIVCGVSSEKIKERLLRERDLTLDKAIDLCRAEEQSKTQLKCISEEVSADLSLVHAINPRPKHQPTVSHGSLPNEEAGAVKPISNQYPTSICRNCGYQHKRDKCPAFGKRCNKCHKFNHFARYCRSSKGVSTLTQKEEEEEHSDADELVVGTLNAKQTVEMGINECFASFRVQDRVIKFKIDTGSQVNVMPLREYNLMHRKPRLVKSRVKLFGYTGDSLKTVGECTLPVGGHQLEFFVADTSQNPILGLNASQELNLVKVVMNVNMQMNAIQQFKDVFSGLGCLKQPYHIKVDPTVKPVISPPRNQPVTIRDRLKTELNKMESMGVIVAVEEPTDWVNSLVVVEKPKTKQLRICLDPRPLNKAIMREHFQLPTLDDIASRLHGAKVFSKLDANHGYWQIPLDRASQLLTTFNTPFGRYCYTRLPFGISSAQEVFQKRMYQLFGDLPGVETDIDDMLIHGRTEEEHQQRLTAVLKRCQEVHLTLNKEKCQFGVPQVTYLGHCISADGITPDENRVKAILAMPPPKDKKGVERLLGTLNYVSKFVPNMSTVTEHIRVLLGKDVPFVWTWEQEAAFENVKKLLSTAPVLAFYDVKQPVTVSCDASQTGLGAVLLQQECPVAYISRALSDTEQRYAQIEKELLAVVFAFEKFNQYVYGRTVSVQSDHKPLESILKKPLHHAPPRLQRMLLRLQKYDFILSYKPGKEMYIADTLSRAYTPDTTVGEMETELAEAVHLVRCLLLKNAINHVLAESKYANLVPTGEQWLAAEKLCALLKPFQIATDFLQGEIYPTLGSVSRIITTLVQGLQGAMPPVHWQLRARWSDLPIIVQQVRSFILKDMRVPSDLLLCMGAITHPGHKSLSWLNPADKNRIVQQLKTEMINVLGVNPATAEEDGSEEAEPPAKKPACSAEEEDFNLLFGQKEDEGLEPVEADDLLKVIQDELESLARQKYMAFLENQRELKKTEQQKRKRETLLEEVDDLKAKKKRLQYDVTALQSSADDYAEKAEGVCEFKVMSQRIAKSNAMRKAATSKLNEIALIEKEIEEKIANLK